MTLYPKDPKIPDTSRIVAEVTNACSRLTYCVLFSWEWEGWKPAVYRKTKSKYDVKNMQRPIGLLGGILVHSGLTTSCDIVLELFTFSMKKMAFLPYWPNKLACLT